MFVFTHGAFWSPQGLPCGTAVVSNHTPYAVILQDLAGDVHASHGLHPVEVSYLPVVRVQVLGEGLGVHHPLGARGVECSVPRVYNGPKTQHNNHPIDTSINMGYFMPFFFGAQIQSLKASLYLL